MTMTLSNMMALGTRAPSFELTDTLTNKTVSVPGDSPSTATIIMFICNHCPFVKHIQTELVQCANDYQARGIRFIAISANDAVNYPADAPDQMTLIGKKLGFPFPYLYDETQAVAKAYQAACTPDFFIFDKDLLCVYRGQLDDSRPGNNIPVTGTDIRNALDAILSNKPVSEQQKPSIGCNIKWKT